MVRFLVSIPTPNPHPASKEGAIYYNDYKGVTCHWPGLQPGMGWKMMNFEQGAWNVECKAVLVIFGSVLR